jgi:hypothetical protein
MKTFTCTLLLATTLSSGILYGQDIDFDRWEVGIDMLTLINQNTIPPSVFVKRLQLKQRKKETGYIWRGVRARVGASFSIPDKAHPYTTNNHIFLVRPGYEWNRQIKSVEVLYGIDAVAYFQNFDDYGPNGNQMTFYRNSTMYLGVSPVMGVSYKIIKNIKISLESSFDCLYMQSAHTYKYGVEDPFTRTDQRLVLQLHPLYVLNAVFVF